MTAVAPHIIMKNLPPLPPPPPPSGAEGIRVMYDEDLSSRLLFKEEIGFGNWGSVWLCMPYAEPSDGRHLRPLTDVKVATKLVHRSRTPTAKARVQSLWNEWKIVTSLRHPSIIDFFSFVVSDSHALITMAYHPRLVSVEVPEQYAKEWFCSLLSGVEYLHNRGIAHNDIKPANILLTPANVPVLIDFGFAKQYDPQAPDAFHSNLSYGTPEYLSPERSAGHLHDSRKSDIWSLGVTFFEILVGRTPFEKIEGEEFNTKEQLHRYWTLTLRGKWVGKWTMSPAMEKLLRRMILPNADLRCTAAAAIADPYWQQSDTPEAKAKPSTHAHRKSGSYSQVNPTADPRRIFDSVPYRQPRHKEGTESVLPSWPKANKENQHSEARCEKSKKRSKDKKGRSRDPLTNDKENARSLTSSPKGNLEREKSRSSAVLGLSRQGTARHGRSQSQSQSKEDLPLDNGALQSHKQGCIQVPSLLGLGALSPTSPAKDIPRKTVRPAASLMFRSKDKGKDKDKENQVLRKSSSVHLKQAGSDSLRRKPLGPRQPSPPSSPALKPLSGSLTGRKTNEDAPTRTVLGDRTRVNRGDRENEGKNAAPVIPGVLDRMREWERERQRLRELERMAEHSSEEGTGEERASEREHREEIEMRRDMERQRMLEIELDRRKEEEEAERAHQMEMQREAESEKERARELQAYHQQNFTGMSVRVDSTSTPSDSVPPTPLSPVIEEPESRYFSLEPCTPNNESSLSILRQSLRMSIDRTKRLYKSSAQALGLTNSASSANGERAGDSHSRSESFSSWEDELREDASLHPAVHSSAENEEMGTTDEPDRMTVWLRNVEKVVEDARQNFAASVNAPLPPLPVAPVARPPPVSPRSAMNQSQRSTRVPRRILPANRIFTNEYGTGRTDQNALTILNGSPVSQRLKEPILQERKSLADIPTIPDEDPNQVLVHRPEIVEVPTIVEMPTTPTRTRMRRATILTRSPEANRRKPSPDFDLDQRKEKSRSQHNLGRPITPVTRLEFELEQLSKPDPSPRLSVLVEKSLHMRDPVARRSSELFAVVQAQTETANDDLTASPLHVEPYPARPQSRYVTLDTPGRRHVEGVYDRFLMSTTGVKRVGLGYQSDNTAPPVQAKQKAPAKRSNSFFLTGKRLMPPPVSSEDLRRTSMSPDEFGAMTRASAPELTTMVKEDSPNPVGIVRRAIKAMTAKR